MANRTVSAAKFVGTVSLGLLTGLSYSLSTITVPTLASLPSASSASSALDSLTRSSRAHLRILTGVSISSFFAAFILSPRSARHPYLLYTGILVAAGQLLASDFLAPRLFLNPRQSSAVTNQRRQQQQEESARRERARRDRERTARARMESSYEVLGASGSDAAHSDEERGEPDAPAPEIANGEEVRSRVEGFLSQQVVSATVSGFGFLISVVGIWGDGSGH